MSPKKLAPKKIEDFLQFCLPFFLLFFSEEKRSRTKSLNRSRRKRETRETVLSKEQVTVRFKRSLLVARTHTTNIIARFGTTRAPRHLTHLKKRIGNWNGPQPRKDYEFSQREEFHDASFRRGVKGEKDDDDDAEEDDDDASCFRSGIFLFGR